MSNRISFAPADDELQRGQLVQVPIVLRLEHAIKVRGIHAHFHGAEETKATYTTTTTNGKGQVSTTTHTAVEHITLVEKEHLLAGRERAGFFANLGDAISTLFGGGRHQLMPPGDYEYTVEVAIPADVPGTHTGDRSRVFYELSCLIDIPLGRDMKEVYSFRVAPRVAELPTNPVRVRYPDDAGRGFWSKLFEPDVRIELALATDVLSRGGSVEGMFQIDTEKPLAVQAIRARLVGHESSQAHGHRDSHRFEGDAIEIATPGNIQGTYSERFSLSGDSVRAMPVSAQGELYSIDWFVQIEFDVPWAKDPTICAPIALVP
jgi:hypothetical protein